MGKFIQGSNTMSAMMRRLVVFTDKYPYVGPIVWILSVQYFIVQYIVASAWPTSYSLRHNYISDLGNTTCGIYDGQYVCSPLHLLMNISFITFGITMALGALLIYTEFTQTRGSRIGFFLMSLSGIGTVLVGVFPENTIGLLHMVGAFLALGIGNLSSIILACVLDRVRIVFRLYTVISGAVSLVAFVLFVSNIYLGIGVGGMERIVSYPFTVWLILFGVYMSAVRYRVKR